MSRNPVVKKHSWSSVPQLTRQRAEAGRKAYFLARHIGRRNFPDTVLKSWNFCDILLYIEIGGSWQESTHFRKAHTPGLSSVLREVFLVAVLTPGLIEEFLTSQERRGIGASSLEAYRRNLKKLYEYLPEGKTLTAETGRAWKKWLEAQGVSPRSINSRLSALNSLCGYLGHREFQVLDFAEGQEVLQPELTRAEYLRLLQAARALEKERVYLLTKTLGGAGLRIQELSQLTVEAVEEGAVELRYHNGRCRRVLRIPAELREELLAYTQRENISDGPVFRTAAGAPIARTYAVKLLQSVSREAQVAAEKATPRCLFNMYCSTREMILSNISILADQAYDRMLAEEQRIAGWAG